MRLLSHAIKIQLTFFITIANFLFGDQNWQEFQQKTLSEMSSIPGWCSQEKALVIMDLIHNHQFQTCVEIGVFSGSSLFPIAKTLQYKGSGVVYAIDAWKREVAVKDMPKSKPELEQWNQLDWNQLYKHVCQLIHQHHLQNHCQTIRQPSEEAVQLFDKRSIDFIHFDGGYGVDTAYQDVTLYFPKLKNNAYILLSDPNRYSMRKALVFLLERAELLSPFTPSANYLLFKKSVKREKNTKPLLKK
jgi:hypothetical protein